MRKDLLASSNFQRGLWHTHTKDEELWPQHDSRVLIWPLPHNPQTLHQTQQNSSYLVLKSVTLVAQLVKNPPAMRENWVWSLGWEDLLEEGMATHPVSLPGESPWTEEPGGYSPWGLKGSDTTEQLSLIKEYYSSSSPILAYFLLEFLS